MRLRPLVLVLVISACSIGTAPENAPASPSPSATATVASGVPAAMTGQRFEVRADESHATIRIREQLINWPAPDDAILTLAGFDGTFAVRDDGTFDPASHLKADLQRMSSDDFRRANAARETMNANRFPLVEFRPVRATGLSLPLGATGKWQFTMIGTLRVNGISRELTWDTTAEREGERLSATARTSFAFGDFAMDVPRRGPVLSIVDEIRLQIDLVAQSLDSATCVATPQDVPANYVPDAPVRSRLGSGSYVFSGVVRSVRGCGRLPGSRVEIWLANPEGRYDANYRATLIADAQGRYRLETDPPGYYGGRPHIHIRVTAEGHRTLVAIFFPRVGTDSGEMDLVLQPN